MKYPLKLFKMLKPCDYFARKNAQYERHFSQMWQVLLFRRKCKRHQQRLLKSWRYIIFYSTSITVKVFAGVCIYRLNKITSEENLHKSRLSMGKEQNALLMQVRKSYPIITNLAHF